MGRKVQQASESHVTAPVAIDYKELECRGKRRSCTYPWSEMISSECRPVSIRVKAPTSPSQHGYKIAVHVNKHCCGSYWEEQWTSIFVAGSYTAADSPNA